MTALEVNGILIYPEAIRAESARLRQEARDTGREITANDALDLLAQAEELLIERVLLEAEALRLGISVEPAEVDDALARFLPASHSNTACRTELASPDVPAEIERRLRIDKLVDRWTKHVKPPNAQAIRQAYADHRSEFEVPESVSVVQIVKNVHHPDERDTSKGAMERVAKELAAGADFRALAKLHSDCPERGGELEGILRGEMVPEFDKVVFALPLNRPSAVFETRFGFHIAMVKKRRDAGLLTFAEAASHISEMLLRQARELEVASRLEALRSQASVRRVKI